MSHLLGTKAEVLERLAAVLTTARVLPQMRMTVREWHDHRPRVLKRLHLEGWLNQPVIVRSSALQEDGTEASLAGQFTSVPHVTGEAEVCSAIDRVVQSYFSPQDGDQIFLQPQLSNLAVSGVAFGIEPVTGGPYLVVNDQRSAHSGEVTGGIACDDELFYWLHGTPLPSEPHLVAVIHLMAELECVLGTNPLDVEFAWADGMLYLLQVRPLVRVQTIKRPACDFIQQIEGIRDSLVQRQTAFPQVLGTGTAWGAMPDWNPAEMIGLRPRPLAAALYRECLTDRTWAEQRRRYGYRDVTGVPLMECFGGQAFIDIRASFTSFVPAALPDELAAKLVAHALHGLRARPELHDKVETELLFHCWTFDSDNRLDRARHEAGLNREDCALIGLTLCELTHRIMDPHVGPWANDRRRMAQFEAWLSACPPRQEPVTPTELRGLLRNCRQAALAFAGLARAGFIAVSLVNSLVTIGVWTEKNRERFFRSQQTVLTQMHTDRQDLTPAEFLSRYGHLRPGTYDILVPRYDETPDRYFLNAQSGFHDPSLVGQSTEMSSSALAPLLSEHGFAMEPAEFLRFLREAIEWREYGKFVYSHGISELLRMLGDYAATLGLSRDDCSYADQSLWDETLSDADFPARLRQAIEKGRAADSATQGLVLSPLILSLDELKSFRFPRCQPNYVTRGVACGPVVELRPAAMQKRNNADLHGAVVMLPSADPGFDWIFSTGIVAFVTKFGGANSHMAIRAREWNLPAAIGVGEVLYRRLVQARALRVDCLHQRLVTLP